MNTKPLCPVCGIRVLRSKGAGKLRSKCWKCRGERNTNAKRRRQYKLREQLTGICSLCGFKAVHLCQMDIDHKDGDHSNNEPENVQEICACCHRLKTLLNKDFEQ